MLENKDIKKIIKKRLIKEQDNIDLDNVEDMVDTIRQNIESEIEEKQELIKDLRKKRKLANSAEQKRWVRQQRQWYEKDIEKFKENLDIVNQMFSMIEKIKQKEQE